MEEPAAYRWIVGGLYAALIAVNLWLVIDVATEGHAGEAVSAWLSGPLKRVRGAWHRHRVYEAEAPRVVFDAMTIVEGGDAA